MNKSNSHGEWARSWPLPLVAMLGITGPAAYIYSSGVFMEPMIEEFGWTRTQFSSALTVQMLLGLVFGPLAGRVVDRVGPRRYLLAGIIPFAFSLSLFGLSDGAMWKWWLFAALLSLTSAMVSPVAWVAGVVKSFDRSRGLALAIAVAGIGVATAVWPMIAAAVAGGLGWRFAYPAIALGWAALTLPLTFAFFRPVEAVETLHAPEPVPPLGPVLRTRAFWGLLGAGGFFASVSLGLIVHLVPILRERGLDLETAASFVGILGAFSILGRLGTGFLIDRFPIRPLAVIAFCMPLVVISLLLAGGSSVPVLMLASALIGLAAGAETDVVTYLTSRKFDRRLFGSVYALFQTGFAIFASLGPLLAGAIFDMTGTYNNYLLAVVPIVIAAAALICIVPPVSAADIRRSNAFTQPTVPESLKDSSVKATPARLHS